MKLTRMTSGAGIVVLATALAGCGMAGEVLSSDDDGEVEIGSLKIGDCLMVDDDLVGSVTSSPKVPCSEPHEDEVFKIVTAELEEFPGEMEIFEHADQMCEPHFEDYIGIPYLESDLFIWAYTPSPESWEAGDREIVCIASTMDETVTESLEGSGR